MYYLAYDKAKEILEKNHIVLEKIVDELLEYEILTGKVRALIILVLTFLNISQFSTKFCFNVKCSYWIIFETLLRWYSILHDFLLINRGFDIHYDSSLQDLERIVADNSGIREEEPFFLTNSRDEEVYFCHLFEWNFYNILRESVVIAL